MPAPQHDFVGDSYDADTGLLWCKTCGEFHARPAKEAAMKTLTRRPLYDAYLSMFPELRAQIQRLTARLLNEPDAQVSADVTASWKTAVAKQNARFDAVVGAAK